MVLALSLSGCVPDSEVPPAPLSIRTQNGDVVVAVCTVYVASQVTLDVYKNAPIDDWVELADVGGRIHFNRGDTIDFANPPPGTTGSAKPLPALHSGQKLQVYFFPSKEHGSSAMGAIFTLTTASLADGRWLSTSGQLSEQPCV